MRKCGWHALTYEVRRDEYIVIDIHVHILIHIHIRMI